MAGQPAGGYFTRRADLMREFYGEIPWMLPSDIDDFRALVESAPEAMDGIQVRYFQPPAMDTNDRWKRRGRLIFPSFPSPQWDSFR